MGASAKTFDDVLKKIRTESKNERQLGDKFESLMINFLRYDSIYKNRFDKVQKYEDWAIEHERTKKDNGIDIMARIRSDDKDKKYCAIQCKCWKDSYRVNKGDLDKFFSEVAKHNLIKHNIDQRIVISTSDEIGATAWDYLNQTNGQVIDKDILRSSSIDWSAYPRIFPKKPHTLYDYQEIAFDDVKKGFEHSERGKLIMACGTGKTLVSLHVAEKLAGKGKLILYLVPSISLILQSMREWSNNANINHHYMAVCSDKSVRNSEDGTMIELEYPASTRPEMLKERLKNVPSDTMNVIFCTYNSIDVVSEATNGKKFDMVFSDEAHRTTSISDMQLDPFYSKVHHNRNIYAKKRLYMTATPRIYTGNVKGKAQAEEKEVISMDDVEIYGPEFHNLKFRDAVHKYKALCDFKIHVTVMDSNLMDKIVQKSQSGDEYSLAVNEQTLLASVWHAIQYPEEGNELKLLQRVIAFCDMINSSKLFAGIPIKHKLDILEKPKEEQENIRERDEHRAFKNLVKHVNTITDKSKNDVDVKHIDGNDNAQTRRRELEWLKSSNDNPNECRIISNARCLSEGVDIPALDGVVFMNPRKSVVDVVQAVGRVMRKAEGKKCGYIILPVALPLGISEDEALSNNKHFRTVWQVLSALKSHDSDLSEEINRLTLSKLQDYPNQITPRIIIKHAYGHDYNDYRPIEQRIINGVATKIIKRIGDTYYYDKYGQKIGSVAKTVETRLKNKIELDDSTKSEIQHFHESLKIMINSSVTEEETVKTIAHHMVLSRIFDVLFAGEFSPHNMIAIAFNDIVKKINFKDELDDLEDFYKDAEREILRIETREERQEFIKKIYGNFMVSADKEEAAEHGIVFTPVEVVDFIINSTQDILKTQFNSSFNDRSVKILDPSTGMGTFITRLLESGYITDNMYKKYKQDIYANDINLLGYYVASVNIETTYSSLRKSGKYVPFDGINYTDTLKMNARYREDEQHRTKNMKIDDPNYERIYNRLTIQKGSHTHVILMNPPYSMKKKSDQSTKGKSKSDYSEIKERVSNTYLINSLEKGAKNTLSDSYIRFIRWTSDRIGESGIIAFITNASFIKSSATDGVRACLTKEFTDVYCFDLKGDGHKTGDGRSIFEYPGQEGGTRTSVAIVILVKNPLKRKHEIKYYTIKKEDYTGQDKRNRVKELKSLQNITWDTIIPDRHHDWIDQRLDEFYKYPLIGNKNVKSDKGENTIFKIYSVGVITSRDAWAYNSSLDKLSHNMKMHVSYCINQDLDDPQKDPKQAKWTDDLSNKIKRNKPQFDKNKIRTAQYKPFFKQHMYFDETFNNSVGHMFQLFPEKYSKNLVICVPYKTPGEFSAYVTDVISDYGLLHIQCFPLYTYVNGKDKNQNITNNSLTEYKHHYKDQTITKEDIFYYVYGLLHHSGYKEKFANNLAREFPRIPMAPNFWEFSKSGKELVDLHLNYETCKKYDLKPKSTFGKLEKMSFPKIKKDDKQSSDKTRLKINEIIAFENIPQISYTVKGRTPLEWMMGRYQSTIDKDSGITNDATADMTEQRTIDMIQRLVYVGTESDKIISKLSKLPFEPKNWTPVKTGLDKFSNVKEYQSKI